MCRWYHLHLTTESVLIMPAGWVRAFFASRNAVIRGRDFFAWPTMDQTVTSLVSEARFGSRATKGPSDQSLVELVGHALLDLEKELAQELTREGVFKQLSLQPEERIEPLKRLAHIRPDNILSALYIVIHQHKLVPAQNDESRLTTESCGLRPTPIIGSNHFEIVDTKLADMCSLPLPNLMLDTAQSVATPNLLPPSETAEAFAIHEIIEYARKVPSQYSLYIEAAPPSRLGSAMRPGKPHVSKCPDQRLASIRLAWDWITYLQAWNLFDHRVPPCQSLLADWQHFQFT